MSTLSQAVVDGASPDVLADLPLPVSFPAHCLRKSEEGIFGELPKEERDVRRSLHLEQVGLPDLAPDEVVIAVMAAGLNYNTVWSAMYLPVPTFRFLESYRREGRFGARHDRDLHTLGSDASGVIVRKGEGVRHFDVGDAVVIGTVVTDDQDPAAYDDGMLPAAQRAWGFETNFGSLAHYAIVKAHQLLPKPAHLTWEEAAVTTLCHMTAYRMLISPRGANVRLGQLVFIWGATGGLGAYGVQLAKAAGCRVVGVVGGAEKAELARRLGCDLVIDRHEARGELVNGFMDVAGWRWLGKRVRAHFGEDPHCVFEHVGRSTFAASVYLVRRGGTVVTCGSSEGYEHEFDNRHLWMKVKRIVGSHGANYHETWESNELIAKGVVQPTLSKVYPFESAAEGIHAMHQNEHVGKLGVLCLAPEEGLGVTDPELRERLGAGATGLFREHA